MKGAADRHGLRVVTEIIEPGQIDMVVEYADVLQIGARNMQNYALLKELGKTDKPMLLKRGMAATIEEWLMSAEYLMSNGNPNVVLCERGIRTFENYTRNTLDLSAVPVVHERSHLPIIVDPSHGTGLRDKVIPMARAGIAAGAAAFGLVFNRLNVGIFGYAADAGQVYFPSLTEWALGIGVIAAAGLVFISLTEYLPIFNIIPAKSFTAHVLTSGFSSARRIWNVVLSHSLNRVSLIAVFILPLGFVLMYPPYDKNSTLPVRPSSGLDITRAVLKIDGNRRNFKTIFDHADHQKRLGDSTSCVKCHHISLPGDRSTPCYRCHRSMYDTTNIFDHESHIVSITRRDSLGGVCPSNNSCVACHQKNEPKTARSSKSCLECHREDMLPNQSEPVQPLNLEYAVSYTDAMHLTCIECHKEQKAEVNKEDLDKCQTCHRSLKKDENIVKAEIATK